MESLVAAQTAYTRLKDRVRHVWNLISKDPGSTTNLTEPLTKALTEDLNTAEALAYIWEVVKEASYDIDSFKTFIEAADKVLGLKLSDSLTEEIQIELPANIQTLIDQRNKAKTNKDWNTADALRTEIENLGYEIADTKDGVKVTKK